MSWIFLMFLEQWTTHYRWIFQGYFRVVAWGDWWDHGSPHRVLHSQWSRDCLLSHQDRHQMCQGWKRDASFNEEEMKQSWQVYWDLLLLYLTLNLNIIGIQLGLIFYPQWDWDYLFISFHVFSWGRLDSSCLSGSPELGWCQQPTIILRITSSGKPLMKKTWSSITGTYNMTK